MQLLLLNLRRCLNARIPIYIESIKRQAGLLISDSTLFGNAHRFGVVPLLASPHSPLQSARPTHFSATPGNGQWWCRRQSRVSPCMRTRAGRARAGERAPAIASSVYAPIFSPNDLEAESDFLPFLCCRSCLRCRNATLSLSSLQACTYNAQRAAKPVQRTACSMQRAANTMA